MTASVFAKCRFYMMFRWHSRMNIEDKRLGVLLLTPPLFIILVFVLFSS